MRLVSVTFILRNATYVEWHIKTKELVGVTKELTDAEKDEAKRTLRKLQKVMGDVR